MRGESWHGVKMGRATKRSGGGHRTVHGARAGLGAKVAIVTLALGALSAVGFVRACTHPQTPVDDDAAAVDACSDDAAVCVAQA